MARGKPHVWGVVLGLPTVLAGVWIILSGGSATAPPTLGYPVIALGVIAIVLGSYVETVAPDPIDVEPIEVFKPSQVSAYLLGAASFPLLIASHYLLFLTRVPYVWPTLTFVGFVYFFTKGLVRYYRNSLTTYYVTEDRVISEYRFLSLRRLGTSIDAVENVSRKQSAIETLAGLGTVSVQAPSADIDFSDLDRPSDAEKLLNKLVQR